MDQSRSQNRRRFFFRRGSPSQRICSTLLIDIRVKGAAALQRQKHGMEIDRLLLTICAKNWQRTGEVRERGDREGEQRHRETDGTRLDRTT